MCNRRMLSRSLKVRMHFNARTRVDTVPEQSPALDQAENQKLKTIDHALNA